MANKKAKSYPVKVEVNGVESEAKVGFGFRLGKEKQLMLKITTKGKKKGEEVNLIFGDKKSTHEIIGRLVTWLGRQ